MSSTAWESTKSIETWKTVFDIWIGWKWHEKASLFTECYTVDEMPENCSIHNSRGFPFYL